MSDDNHFVSKVGKRRLKSLLLPEKRKKIAVEEVQIIAGSDKKDSFECPLCSEIMYKPYPARINAFINKIKENTKQYKKEQEAKYKLEIEELRKEGRPIPPFVVEPPGMSENDKLFICRTHRIELEFKPMAEERNYPKHIDFEAISERIALFEKDLKSIVNRETPSTYLDSALERYKELGIKAKNPSEVLKIFEQLMPGYYGNKGLDYIMEALDALLLKTDYLNEDNASPLAPVEFIQQILVPECAIRLIRQDRNNEITLQEATIIMKESQQYGSIVYFKSEK